MTHERATGVAGFSLSTSTRWLTPALAIALGLLAAGTAGAAEPTRWVKGRLIVQTRAGLSDAQFAKIVAPHQGKARRIGRSELRVVELPASVSETAVRERLARHPHVKFVELDGLAKPLLVSNDPYLGSQWHLTKIGATTAWDSGQGLGQTIAVIDTGVDAAHPDLAGRIVAGWNYFDNTADTSDAYGHGTSVAGSAAAATNNGLGVAGVAGQAKVMPLRVSDATGYGSWSAMAQALIHAADRGVRVANISYMVGGVSTVQSAAAYMKSRNGLVFVSAGNTGGESTSAPNADLVVVGATGSGDARAGWSTYGSYVALAAPGEGIYTATRGGGYGSVSGTSFSSPVAAGVAAALMSAKPTLSNTQVEQILFATAADLGAAGRDPYFGHGRVDAAAAMRLALATPAVDSVAPTAAITSPTASASVQGLVAVDVAAADDTGVARVELSVNGTLVASDVVAPFGFSWDSSGVSNGMATLRAVAYDAAGNASTASTLSVNVANAALADTSAPVARITNPGDGAKVSGIVAIAGDASDDAGATGLTLNLKIDGKVVATATGGTLRYNWNTRKVASGNHSVTLVATDAARNSTTKTVTVVR